MQHINRHTVLLVRVGLQATLFTHRPENRSLKGTEQVNNVHVSDVLHCHTVSSSTLNANWVLYLKY